MSAARDQRVLSSDVRSQELHPEPGAADEAATSALALNRLGGVEIGIWSIEPGVATDVEADEVFVVLSGRATIAIQRGTVEGSSDEAGSVEGDAAEDRSVDGSSVEDRSVDSSSVEVVEVGAGSAVRLNAGERTVWTVHETLRKVYVTTL